MMASNVYCYVFQIQSNFYLYLMKKSDQSLLRYFADLRNINCEDLEYIIGTPWNDNYLYWT